MRVGLIGDIHSCAETYQSALAQLDDSGCDLIVILGDLLTYGMEPQKVIDLTHEVVNAGGVLIRGNHDQIYIDQESGGSSYERALPSWIGESVQWTRKQIGDLKISQAFNWQDSWSHDDLFIAHANPYAYGDWTYLSSDAAFSEANKTLIARGFRKGIFGHTHRFRRFESQGDVFAMMTIGSLGQPRNCNKQSEWCVIDLVGDSITVKRKILDHSWDKQLAAIENADLSRFTKDQLSKFFRS